MLAVEPEFNEEIRLTFENVGQCMFRMDCAIPWIQELKVRGYKVLYPCQRNRPYRSIPPRGGKNAS